MSKEKKVLMTIGPVRIVEHDTLNVIVERLEEVTNPVTKEKYNKHVHKGYFSSIVGALTAIVNKEWLIDRNTLSDLKSYLKQVHDSNNLILEELKK